MIATLLCNVHLLATFVYTASSPVGLDLAVCLVEIRSTVYTHNTFYWRGMDQGVNEIHIPVDKLRYWDS